MWIYWFEKLRKEHNDLVGKKCANLGELAQLNVRTPPGFALSITACERFMEESGAGDEIRGYVKEHFDLLKDVREQIKASKRFRHIIESKDMPADMEQEIASYYAELCDHCEEKDLAVAVRSSGAISMPGQMETCLNVRGKDNVIRKVIQVWGSAFTTRALAFRLENRMEIENAPIGVAVLKMVSAKCAGVVLTVLPNTGDTSKAVVEGNWGLGESVVSGEVTPDRFIVEKESGEIESYICKKPRMVVHKATGTKMIEVPEEMQEESCLLEGEIKEIVRIAKEVEACFGQPQDMEWVIDRDLPFPENLYWVQTRPARYIKKKMVESEYLAELMTRIYRM